MRSAHTYSWEMQATMLAPIAILCLLGSAAGKLRVETDPSPFRAVAGNDVALKCSFTVNEAIDLSKLVIQWFHRGKQLVEFDDVVTSEKSGFTLSQEGLTRGNASLLITKAQPENSGIYRCYVTYSPELRIKDVILEVNDPSKPPQEQQEDSVPDPCPLHPDPQVLGKLERILSTMEQIGTKLDELRIQVAGSCNTGPSQKGGQAP